MITQPNPVLLAQCMDAAGEVFANPRYLVKLADDTRTDEAVGNATIAYSARLLTNDNDAAELFDEAAGYRTPALAAAITRAILSKDATALLALMDALHTAAFDRQVESDAVEILEEH